MREPYEFVVAEGGVLRAYDRLLEVQQSLHHEDVPVAERNLFQLRGNVREVGYVRAYREDFLKTMDKDTNGFPSVAQYVQVIVFLAGWQSGCL